MTPSQRAGHSNTDGDTAATSGPEPGEGADVETLREEIAETREQLGATVEALAGKTDVKAQVAARVEQRRQRLAQLRADARARMGRAVEQARTRPGPVGGAIAALFLALVAVLWVGRRKR